MRPESRAAFARRLGTLAVLLLNLTLAAYQKQLGGKLGVVPGTELLEATAAARELGIEGCGHG